MTCHNVQSRLSAYLDGEISGQDKAAIRAHLHDCGECYQEVQALTLMKSLVADLPAEEPAEDLEEKLVQSVLKKPAKHRAPVFTRGLAYVSGFAFAAALFTGILWLRHGRVEPVASSPSGNEVSFEVARDQAYFAGADPLGGGAPIISASYGSR